MNKHRIWVLSTSFSAISVFIKWVFNLSNCFNVKHWRVNLLNIIKKIHFIMKNTLWSNLFKKYIHKFDTAWNNIKINKKLNKIWGVKWKMWKILFIIMWLGEFPSFDCFKIILFNHHETFKIGYISKLSRKKDILNS